LLRLATDHVSIWIVASKRVGKIDTCCFGVSCDQTEAAAALASVAVAAVVPFGVSVVAAEATTTTAAITMFCKQSELWILDLNWLPTLLVEVQEGIEFKFQ